MSEKQIISIVLTSSSVVKQDPLGLQISLVSEIIARASTHPMAGRVGEVRFGRLRFVCLSEDP